MSNGIFKFIKDIFVDDDDDDDDDDLETSDEDVDSLTLKAEDIERDEDNGQISFKGLNKKVCATRHGCQGATDCDYAYGDYD